MSYWPDDLTAIQYAAGRGVIVVEAAGNGAEHLDDAAYAGPGPGFRPHRPNPFLRDGLDSGSILVGAGAPPGGRRGPDRSRLRFSNWGGALDAQGWGRDVATTGGIGAGADATRPGDDEDAWYTDAFAGTSSAAPMVAGALACVQGVLRAAGREPLDARAGARRAARDRLAAAGREGRLAGAHRQPARHRPADRLGHGRHAPGPPHDTTTQEDTPHEGHDHDRGRRRAAASSWGGAEGPHIRGPAHPRARTSAARTSSSRTRTARRPRSTSRGSRRPPSRQAETA